MTVHYLDLADYLAIAAEITELDADTLSRVARLSLADSALHAPAAGWGVRDLYPEFIDKAAVLLVRLTNNHPLPDGNKRCAWVALRVFVEINAWEWTEYPDIDDAEAMVVAIASGKRTEQQVAAWLAPRLRPPVG